MTAATAMASASRAPADLATSTSTSTSTSTANERVEVLLDALEADERALRALEARRSRRMGEAYLDVLARTDGQASTRRELAIRSLAAELGIIQSRSDRTALARLERAAELLTRLPATQAWWEEGRIDRAHAECIARHGADIDDEARRAAFEQHLLQLAAETTPGRLEAPARRLAAHASQLDVDEQHAKALEERRVWLRPIGDGLAELGLIADETTLRLVFDRATAAANLTRELAAAAAREHPDAAADERTQDQRRADFLLDLLTTADPASIVLREDGGAPRIDAKVTLVVPVLSMVGESVDPCELRGGSPVPKALAFELCANATEWERALTDPISDVPLAVDRYRPSEGMRRVLALRDQRCRFPGCRQRAEACDLDHTVDAAAGGPTALGNLAHLCRWHHTLKHHTGLAVAQLGGGRLRWTTPSGRTRTDAPELPGVRFRPPPEPPLPDAPDPGRVPPDPDAPPPDPDPWPPPF